MCPRFSLLFDLVSEQRKRTSNLRETRVVFLLVVEENHFTSQSALWWPASGTGRVCVTPTSSGGWDPRGVAGPSLPPRSPGHLVQPSL